MKAFFRPTLSAMIPQVKAPMATPARPRAGWIEARDLEIPHSSRYAGMMKDPSHREGLLLPKGLLSRPISTSVSLAVALPSWVPQSCPVVLPVARVGPRSPTHRICRVGPGIGSGEPTAGLPSGREQAGGQSVSRSAEAS